MFTAYYNSLNNSIKNSCMYLAYTSWNKKAWILILSHPLIVLLVRYYFEISCKQITNFKVYIFFIK